MVFQNAKAHFDRHTFKLKQNLDDLKYKRLTILLIKEEEFYEYYYCYYKKILK